MYYWDINIIWINIVKECFSKFGRHMHGCSCRWYFIGFVTLYAPATPTTLHTSFDLFHRCRPRNLQSFRVPSGQFWINAASNKNSPNMWKHWAHAAKHTKISAKPRTLIYYMSFRALAILLCFERSSYDLPWGWQIWSKCCYSEEPVAFDVSLTTTCDMGGRVGMHSIHCRRKYIDPHNAIKD